MRQPSAMPWPSSAVNSGPRQLSQAHGITETRRNSQPTCSAAFCSSPADRPDVQTQAEAFAEGNSVPDLPPLASDNRHDKDPRNAASLLRFFSTALKSGFLALRLRSAPPSRATFTSDPRLRLAIGAASALSLIVGAGVVTWSQLRTIRSETAGPGRLALPLPEKPSVAVMPFANLSSDAAQDLISQRLTESLVNALARSPFLLLIAHS